jgi:hypothetical protein
MPAMEFPRTMQAGRLAGRRFKTAADYQRALRESNGNLPPDRPEVSADVWEPLLRFYEDGQLAVIGDHLYHRLEESGAPMP